ncbi:hypothetical protein [Salinigranum halophilum]|uniref:hypothetical protein n=1 Tax=Salinigranum halophilum TaxID=2565931 RepID=UPI0010A87F46|nr:hypothetical protein [Salinigranum halophilum]
MEAHIFAEASQTTASDDQLPFKEYYQGLFSSVATLYEDIESVSDAHLHILSEEYGVTEAEETPAGAEQGVKTPVGYSAMIEQGKQMLNQVSATADILVILLSSDIFQDVVCDVWEDLVEVAQPNSIWCLGAARSALDKLDTSRLDGKDCTVIFYRRTGVARIGKEAREELLLSVKQKSNE